MTAQSPHQQHLAWVGTVTGSCLDRSTTFARKVLPILAKWAKVDLFVDDHQLNSLPFDPAYDVAATKLPVSEDMHTWHSMPVYHFLRAASLHEVYHYDAFMYHCQSLERSRFALLASKLMPGMLFLYDGRLLEVTTRDDEPIADGPNASDLVELEENSLTAFTDTSALLVADGGIGQAVGSQPMFSFSPVWAFCNNRPDKMPASFSGRYDDSAQYILIHDPNSDVGDSASGRFESILDAVEQLLARSTAPVSPPPSLVWLADNRKEKSRIERFVEQLQSTYPNASSSLIVELVETDDELQYLLDRAKLAVCFSARWNIGLDQLLVAAMCSSVPVITSNIGPAQELPEGTVYKIRHGLDESYELAHAIEALLLNTQLTDSLKSAAQSYALSAFSPEVAAMDLLCALEQSLATTKDMMKTRAGELLRLKSQLWGSTDAHALLKQATHKV